MFRKIITYFLILAVVLPVFASAVPLPVGKQDLGVSIAHAEDTTGKTGNDQQLNDPCGWFMGAGSAGTMWECVSYTIMNLMYDWVLNAAIFIAGLAGELFNTSIQFSLTGKVFDANENTMIKDGWTLVRDLLNLVFIFILLFAAISTILQYGDFQIKKVLPGLIIVALLVNFSMLITKMVIDASHIFAWEFYNQIDVKNEEKLGDGKTLANMKGSVEMYGDFEKKNLANVFIAGFNPQELLTGSDKDDSKSQWKQVLDDAISKGGTYTNTWWQLGLILLLESALAIFAAFILLAGAIMFVLRVVVLWLVMIFSPIAFLGMILPSMQQYSSMWWKYLIGQSFFAPAFLFMFMLVTKFINSDFIDSIFNATNNSDLKIVLGLDGGAIALTFFHFFIVGGLMMACLIVAKQLGGKTAEFGIGGAHRVKGWALGTPGKALSYGFNNRLARWGFGKLADKTMDEKEGWGNKRWAKTITTIPGVEIGLRKLGAMKKSDEDKDRKKAEKYAGTLSSAGRTALDRDIKGGFIKRFLYTGPEGAFKPGKEGYEKIIGRKKAEKYEEEKYYKNLAILADIKDSQDSMGKIVTGGDTAKSMMKRGEEEKLDKLIEDVTKKIAADYEKVVEGIEDNISAIAVDLTEQNSRLYTAIENKDPVDAIKKKIIDLEKNKSKENGQKIIMDKKKKEREDIQKAVEKYEAKQDTEKLGAKFSSSGAGGGGGGKGGGGSGKTMP